MGIFDQINESEQANDDGKNRLFQTHVESSGKSRTYLKLLGIVVVVVIIAGIVVSYVTLPQPGDLVRAPKGLEEAVRDHFLVNEKRTATDVTVYYCGTFYWARVGVEKRPDIKTNPLYLLSTYTARATADEGKWKIMSGPVTSPEMDVPCN